MTNLKPTTSTINEIEISHKFIAINFIQLHVALAGKPTGKPILLLHGFPDYWKTWRYQISALVNAGFWVIMPDQRGFNLSDKPKGVANYHIDVLSSDIIALLDYFGLKKTMVAGHDWGGVVTWQLLMNYPERFERAVLLNAPHLVAMNLAFMGSPLQLLRSWYIFVFQIPLIAEYLFYPFLIKLFWNKNKGTHLDEEDYVALTQKGMAKSTISWYRSAFRSFISKPVKQLLQLKNPFIGFELPPISVPLLLIWGENDVALTQSVAIKSMEICKNGRLEMIEGATHWVHWDKPILVNERMIFFLEKRSL